jgi:hypothetical protein
MNFEVVNTTIWFENECLRQGFVPKYAVVKIRGITEDAKRTTSQTERLRIKNEIKDFYKKVNGLLNTKLKGQYF